MWTIYVETRPDPGKPRAFATLERIMCFESRGPREVYFEKHGGGFTEDEMRAIRELDPTTQLSPNADAVTLHECRFRCDWSGQ